MIDELTSEEKENLFYAAELRAEAFAHYEGKNVSAYHTDIKGIPITLPPRNSKDVNIETLVPELEAELAYLRDKTA